MGRKKMPDSDITRPKHYHLSPEPLDVIEAWGLGFCEGNVLKYIARWKRKNGVADLRKAATYLERFIEEQERVEAVQRSYRAVDRI